MKPKNWIARRMANDGISKADIAYAIKGTCLEDVEVGFDEACDVHQSLQFLQQIEDLIEVMRSPLGAAITVRPSARGYLLGIHEEGLDEDDMDEGDFYPIIRLHDEGSAIAAGEAMVPMLEFLMVAPLFGQPYYLSDRDEVEKVLLSVACTRLGTDAINALGNRDIKDGPYCVGDSIWISKWCPLASAKTPEGVLLAEVAAMCMGHFKNLISKDIIGQMCLPYADDLFAAVKEGAWEQFGKRAENVLEHMRGPVQLRSDVAPRKLTVTPGDRPAQVAGWRYIPALRAAQSEYCRVLFFDPNETLPEQGKLLPVAGKGGQKWLAWLDPDFGASRRLDANDRKVAVLHAADTFLHQQWG